MSDNFILPGEARLLTTGHPNAPDNTTLTPICSLTNITHTSAKNVTTGNLTNCADPRRPGDTYRIVGGSTTTIAADGQAVMEEFEFLKELFDATNARVYVIEALTNLTDTTSDTKANIRGTGNVDNLVFTGARDGVATFNVQINMTFANFTSDQTPA